MNGERPAGPIRLLLVDDQQLFRGALVTLLNQQPDMQVVGEATNGLEAIERAHEVQPDVVLLDVEMPVMDGVDAARLLLDQLPGVKVVMLTVAQDDSHLMRAIELGVHGYLLKDLHPEELYTMIRAVQRNETPVSPALVGRLLAQLRLPGRAQLRHSEPEAAEPHLSQRELEIMRLVATGISNKEIGQRLSITEGTVKNHVHNALHKLHMDNRIQAAAYIVRHGLGSPPAG